MRKCKRFDSWLSSAMCSGLLLVFGIGMPLRAAAPSYPYATLGEAFAGIGFDPAAKGAAYFVACTDPHVNLDKGHEFPAFVIDEVKAMEPPPAFLVITGDTICSASLSFGNRPNAAQKEKARQEFRLLKQALDRLPKDMPVHLIPGNHDTYPGEKDAALMREVFPEMKKPYRYEEVAGVPLFFLNAGCSGDLDPEQRAWLAEQVKKIARDREAIIFVHQPSLGSTVNERGIPLALSAAFADHRGPLWMLAGHHHTNRDAVFAIGKTTIVQTTMATCGLRVWGGPEKPGYWVYCLRDGHVAGRIYRRHEKGFRAAPLPARDKPRPIVPPFAGLENLEKKILVGEGDRKFLVAAKAGDVVSWWAYLSDVHYRFPLSLFERKPTRLAVLASLARNPKHPEKSGHVFLSSDGENWTEVEPEHAQKGYYVFLIPAAALTGENLHVRVTGPGYKGGVVLGGFAFCAPPQ